MEEDEEEEEDADDPGHLGPSTPKKTRLYRGDLSKEERPKHRQQKFRTDWLKMDVFKMWLAPLKSNEYGAYCKFCKQTLVSEIGVLKNHSKGKKHIQIMQGSSSKQQSITSFTTKEKSPDLKKQLVSIAEIKLAGYFAEHNIPFLAADHISDLMKEIFPDSEIAKYINVKRTKTTAIVKNVIGVSQKIKLATKLKKQKFSLLTDESTDIGTVKTSCVVVR